MHIVFFDKQNLPHQMLNNNELISAIPKQVAIDFVPTFSAGNGEQALWASFPRRDRRCEAWDV